MAKQKFRCEGVLRKTGQRVAVEVLAESQEIAVKMAEQHGVTVGRIGLVQAPKPAAARAAAEELDENDEKVDGLLDSLDPSDPFDLAGAAGGPAPSGAPMMKACPYCGEPILAVAIKCKHCGAGIPATARSDRTAGASPTQPDFHGNLALYVLGFSVAVTWLLLPVVLVFGTAASVVRAAFWISAVASSVALIWTMILPAVEAERVKAETGAVGWFLLTLILWPVAFPMWMYCRKGYGLKNLCVPAAILVLLFFAGDAWLTTAGLYRLFPALAPAPPYAPPPAVARSAPPAPKPEAPKASPEELAFAKNLTAFLDVCDATVKVMEDGAPSNTDKKRHEALAAMVTRYSTIGAPPRGVAWAEEAAKDAGGLAEVATLAIAAATTNEAFKELGQAPSDPAATAAAYRDAATRMRDIVAMVRAKIPPACVSKTP